MSLNQFNRNARDDVLTLIRTLCSLCSGDIIIGDIKQKPSRNIVCLLIPLTVKCTHSELENLLSSLNSTKLYKKISYLLKYKMHKKFSNLDIEARLEEKFKTPVRRTSQTSRQMSRYYLLVDSMYVPLYYIITR
eukprot:UN26306